MTVGTKEGGGFVDFVGWLDKVVVTGRLTVRNCFRGGQRTSSSSFSFSSSARIEANGAARDV